MMVDSYPGHEAIFRMMTRDNYNYHNYFCLTRHVAKLPYSSEISFQWISPYLEVIKTGCHSDSGALMSLTSTFGTL